MSDMAMRYAMMKKRAKRCMAEGGEVDMPEETDMSKAAKSIKKAFGSGYKDGGFVEDEEASGYLPMPEEDEMGMEDDDDIVSRAMKHYYSKGGKVANDTPPMVDKEENDFDDLALRDDLDEHYTGANSGDEIGDHKLDEDDRDVVSRVMKSRRLKDRMPRPA
jgi:hypothetical protein